MYSIDGDIGFDEYATEMDSEYINKDFDVVEQQRYEEEQSILNEDTDVQFE